MSSITSRLTCEPSSDEELNFSNFLAPEAENIGASSSQKAQKLVKDFLSRRPKRPRGGDENQTRPSRRRIQMGEVAHTSSSKTSNRFFYPAIKKRSPIPAKALDVNTICAMLTRNSTLPNDKEFQTHFKHMLNMCWDVIDRSLEYSDTYPLFLEKDLSGHIDVLVSKENCFYFLGSAIGSGTQSVVRNGVLVHYDKKQGFTFDCVPVAGAHASQAELTRIKNQTVKLRYSKSVLKLIKDLGEHPHIVPKPVFRCIEPSKVMKKPAPAPQRVFKSAYDQALAAEDARFSNVTPKGLTIGQISIEPIVFDNASHKHRFSSMDEFRQRALHVAIGLKHIHDHGIIHRDLKADNILIEGMNTRIGDLELLHQDDEKDCSGRVAPSLGHLLKVTNCSQERMAFGYLIKEWLSMHLKRQNQKACSEKQEAFEMPSRPLQSSIHDPLQFSMDHNIPQKHTLIKKSEVESYNFPEKEQWEALFDFAHTLTHNADGEPRETEKLRLEAPILLNEIIEKLQALDLNS